MRYVLLLNRFAPTFSDGRVVGLWGEVLTVLFRPINKSLTTMTSFDWYEAGKPLGKRPVKVVGPMTFEALTPSHSQFKSRGRFDKGML